MRLLDWITNRARALKKEGSLDASYVTFTVEARNTKVTERYIDKIISEAEPSKKRDL